MDLRTLAFDDLLKQLAAKSPVPGGGAATAAVAALGAALGAMVVNYSIGRKDLAAHQPALEDAVERIERARWLMLELAREDMQAYEALNDAMKRPKDDPQRQALVSQRSLDACAPPMALIAACADLLRLFSELKGITNRHLRSDLAIAALLAEAAARATRWNIWINAPALEPAQAQQQLAQADEMLTHAARDARAIEEACRV